MSIFDMFRQGTQQGNRPSPSLENGQNPQNFGQPPQGNQGNPPPQNNDQNPNPQSPQNNQQQKETPDDPFKEFWTIGKDQKQPQDLADFQFNFDPAKVDQQVQSFDFTKAITPDILEKIQKGGPESVSALLTAMNVVGQQAAKAALLTSTKVTESGIKSFGQRSKEVLPELVRNHTVSNALREDNPLYTDPATAPVVAAIEAEFTKRFPTATAQEIRDHAKKYFERFASKAAEFSGKTITDTPDPKTVGSNPLVQTDWSTEPT